MAIHDLPPRENDTRQPRPVVAFQGEMGSFSEQAVDRWWNGSAVLLPQRDSARVIDAVDRGAADFGILPVANTIAGEVATNRAAIAANPRVREEGTVTLDIVQSLLALPGASLDAIRTVASHPVALAQCARFFAANPRLRAVESYDTAGAARDVAAHASSAEAAIASPSAAQLYGLDVLLENVSDSAVNRTTFAVITVDGARRTRRSRAGDGEKPTAVSTAPRIHAIRGATTARADCAADICDATAELLRDIARLNHLTTGEIVSVSFTVTSDLRSEFPARAARELGWDDVAMLCASSIPVPGSLPRCIRVMLHAYTGVGRDDLQHVYLHGARKLRPDLASD